MGPSAECWRRASPIPVPPRYCVRTGAMTDVTVLRAERWADVDTGEVRSPAVVVVDGDRIQAVNPPEPPADSTDIDLGDVTLLPGLMDMELNLLIGGPGGPEGLPNPMHGVQDDPVYRTLRGAVNARTTLEAGFTTVRNLGLMVKTGGYLLDVALQRAIDQGWHIDPRIFPAGHAVTPYGGHLDPTVFHGSRRASCRFPSPRASRTVSTMYGRACGIRFATAPS